MLSISIVSGFEGYVVEEPVFEERWHEGFAFCVLHWRFQLGKLLFVELQRFGGSSTVALEHKLLIYTFCFDILTTNAFSLETIYM